MLEEYIKLLRPEVEEMFKSESSGHDISHLERTMNNALYIQEKEGGNRLVVGVSAFLHDIHRLKQNETGKYCSPVESLPIVKELLGKVKFPNELINDVLNAIEHHETYNWNEDDVKTDKIEALILQDADNLDGVGAMGIARTFAYAGAHKLALYKPEQSLEEALNRKYSEDEDDEESTIHHFYHKLFKLGDFMNTKTARELAKQRTDYMKAFVNQFLNEWYGKYDL